MGTDYSEKMQRYMEALEEERRKILVFQRELPLCLELVTQAIGACQQQLSATGVADCNDNGNGQSECSEQTSTEGTPVLEEFIPMKRPSSSEDDEDDEEEQHSHKQTKMDKESSVSKEKSSSADSKMKSDWLKSAQLWNQTPPDPPAKEEHRPPRKVSVVEVTRSGGAFQPFNKDQKGSAKSHPPSEKPRSPPPAATTSSTTENAAGGRKEEKERQTQTQTPAQRKQRRCWSPELHRRFLQALQQLGGSHAATPKQIRELMKVDGLTNDEVKSHLQKFRLHTRRPGPPIHSSSSSSSQPPQIVVVGGIWVPPHEYAAAASTDAAKAAAAGRIYAPVALPATPPPLATTAPEANSTQNPQSEEGRRSGHSSHSNSSPSSTSSSSHTTTASPLY